ncbi:hypothetical protein [Tenacibaculum finnmarkense]|nr:hypothetical protein [Tenacibaculum finnmarkense]
MTNQSSLFQHKESLDFVASKSKQTNKKSIWVKTSGIRSFVLK